MKIDLNESELETIIEWFKVADQEYGSDANEQQLVIKLKRLLNPPPEFSTGLYNAALIMLKHRLMLINGFTGPNPPKEAYARYNEQAKMMLIRLSKDLSTADYIYALEKMVRNVW